ncbi:MAG: hypothetical protein TYPL_5130 [Candidatus Tyloplasma litorale]|nr:MAG: hypothetical protein TYPL_5130 [Mycoplasmatales bacterium]
MWIKWLFYISLIPILTLILFLSYFSFVNFKKYYNLKKLEKTNKLNFDNYQKLDLIEKNPDYRIPNGQKVFFIYDQVNVSISQKQRKYTGNSKTGIRFPFMKLNLQNREFYDVNTFVKWGECKIFITNKIVRIISDWDKPLKKEIKIIDIENINLVDDVKTVLIRTKTISWPIKISFKLEEKAFEFQNALWTIYFKIKEIRK